MKTKKMLLSILALNSVYSVNTEASGIQQTENKIIKHLNQGKTTSEQYKFLNKILDKRNKELQDLYIQGDYIVKPEYLEWQIFFKAFSSHKDRGGEKLEPVNQVLAKQGKKLYLEKILLIKKNEKENLQYTLSDVNEPAMKNFMYDVSVREMEEKKLEVDNITIASPVYKTDFTGSVARDMFLDVGTVTNNAGYFSTGDILYGNVTMNTSGTVIDWDASTSQMILTGASTYTIGSSTLNTGQNETHTLIASNTLGINNISQTGDYTINGNWDFNFTKGSTGKSVGFIVFRPQLATQASSVTFDGVLNINDKFSANTGGYNYLAGMSMIGNAGTSGNLRLINNGKIYVNSENDTSSSVLVTGMYGRLQSGQGELINNGTIYVNAARNSYTGSRGVGIGITPSTGILRVKAGNIKVLNNGYSGGGLIIGTNSSTNPNSYSYTTVEDGIIDLNSVGVGLGINSIVATSQETNLIGGVKNISINMNATGSTPLDYSSRAIGVNLFVPSKDGKTAVLNDQVISNLTIESETKGSTLIKVNTYGAIIDSSMGNVINNNAGEYNTVLDVGLSYPDQKVKNYMPVIIGENAKGGTGIWASSTYSDSSLENYGDITINSKNDGTGNYSAGIVSFSGDHYNFGNIEMNGDFGIGIITPVTNSEINTSGNIIVNGNNGINLYAKSGTIKHISGDLEMHGENGRLLYTDQTIGGIIIGETGSVISAVVDNKNSYFLNVANNNFTKTTVNGVLNADIKNGSFGFNYNGSYPSLTLSEYLGKLLNLSNGTLNMAIDNDSYLFNITNATMDLSNIANTGLTGFNITGTKGSYITNSKLTVDIDSNLDKNNNLGDKTYGSSKLYGTGVTVNSGITITGTEDGQTGIISGINNSSSNLLVHTNNGIIDLSGNNATGIYAGNNVSQAVNKGNINVDAGTGGVGIYAKRNGAATVQNLKEIKIRDGGVGIYAELPGGTLNLTNNGNIIGTGNNVTGIYVNNISGATTSSSLKLGSNSNIDLENTVKGVGIYTNDYNITEYSSSGTISVGENGVGVYAKNGSAYLWNLTLNLKGDNTVGIYTDGTNSFTGSGTINVEGNGTVVFNILGSGDINNYFDVVSTPGLTYTLANLKNSTFVSENVADLGQGSVYINGENSAAVLGFDSKLASSKSDLVGIAVKGKSANLPSYLSSSSNTYYVESEAINAGLIDFGNNSMGIYATDGASGENWGEINLGDDSVGIYGKGSGSKVVNTNIITIDSNSDALFLSNGESIRNDGIISGGRNSVGMHSESSFYSVIENNGTLNFAADNIIGIYAGGSGKTKIDNVGDIIAGNSTTSTEVSIGIYGNSSENIIDNSGTIISGTGSIGIYNKNGSVNNSGTVKIAANGVGIYAEAGEVNLTGGSIDYNGSNGIGIYAKENVQINNNAVFGVTDNSYGIILNSGSSLINTASVLLGEQGVFVYSKGAGSILNESSGNITISGSNSTGFFIEDDGNLINKASIDGKNGTGNMGIYVKSGSITNEGNISIGDSVILSSEDFSKNTYSVGIYGENLGKLENTGNIEIGKDGIGIFSVENNNEAVNKGDIISNSENAVGIYLIKSSMRNEGDIILSGNNSVGIGVGLGSVIKNAGSIVMNGDSSIGIHANTGSTVINESTGKIYINGDNSTGIQLSGNSILENYGLIEVAAGTINSSEVKRTGSDYEIPSIINAGIIKVDEKFELDGFNLIIKPDPTSFRTPTIEEITINGYAPEDINGGFLLSNTVSIAAPAFETGTNAVNIDSSFTQGTNARVYKFENVFDPLTPEGGINDGELTLKSFSLTFDAIPNINSSGKVDIWMEKINYSEFTKGIWQDEFAENIEKNYLNASGDALKLYDKLDLITEQSELNRRFDELSGSVYANMNQREQIIGSIFEDSLELMETSKNNTKENVKLNIIAGKGTVNEDTTGIVDYDYTTTGIMALREVERTYRHTFGYSLGYQHTKFDFNDGNKSEEKADSIQLGLHNTYKADNWKFRNEVLGRVTFYDMDRNIKWGNNDELNLNSNYETYSVYSNNSIGREFSLGRHSTITPYAGINAGYIIRPSFEEKESEGVKVEGNDAWTVKPKIGVELSGSVPLDKKDTWKLKGSLDIAYEYELGNIDHNEEARLSLLENDYHSLAEPEEEKGRLRTKASIGVEIEDRYGIFLTGEYGISGSDKEDYRAGVTLKAVF